MPLHWNVTHHLNIFVLGPMPSPKSVDSSCRAIKNALVALLKQSSFSKMLKKTRTSGFTVRVPEELDSADIVTGVFSEIDAADLIVLNITPKDQAAGSFSPNVFYELGFLHALGIPYLLVRLEGTPAPFYVSGSRIHTVADFGIESLKSAFREPLRKFLIDASTDLSVNPITDFYGLPVVDISAALGVASGYYENFVRRGLLENGFIGRNGEEFRHLIVCRPSDIVDRNFEQDFLALKKLVQRKFRVELKRKVFPMIENFDKRDFSGHFVNDVMIDIPTAAYTLKRSPRLRALERRTLREGKLKPTPASTRLMRQASEKLLDQFESCVEFYAAAEIGLRKSALTFSSLDGLPDMLRELKAV